MKSPGTFSTSRLINGFTLVELMLVMALVLIVGIFTSGVGVSYYRSQVLNETADNLVSSLRHAQGYALSGKDNSAFGVYIHEDSYVMFEGQDYESRVEEEDMVFPISANITMSGPVEIVFSELTGTPNVTETIYLTLGSREKQIDILPSGYIDK
jgi:prepilin-type N-terminal cleavage/methylation domain-containing protein